MLSSLAVRCGCDAPLKSRVLNPAFKNVQRVVLARPGFHGTSLHRQRRTAQNGTKEEKASKKDRSNETGLDQHFVTQVKPYED